jgi:amidase
MSSSIGTAIEISNAHRDLLSPYMVEMLGQVGAVGPRQAEEADALVERLHRQVQQRVFEKGYRVVLMPTMASPLVGADMFKSKKNDVDPWTGTGLGFALTWHWNLLNRYPVIDVPLGIVDDRMPSGMQVIGQTFTDLDTFQFAFNWSRLRPPLFADGRFPTFA